MKCLTDRATIMPALLAALQASVAAMERYEINVDDSPTSAHRAMMQQAREAIAAAKGAE